MSDFTFVSTLSQQDQTALTGVTDLGVRSLGGVTTLYVTSRSADLTSIYGLAADGTPGLDASVALPVDTSQLEIITIGGVDHALAIGPGLDDLPLWEIAADGSFINPQIIPTSGSAYGGLSDIAAISLAGTTFLYGVGNTTGALYGYQINAASNGQSNAPPPLLNDISRVDTILVDGNPLVLTVSGDGRTITAWQAATDGSLTEGGSIGAADGLGVGGIVELQHLSLPDGDYIVVAARDSSSLSVLAVEPDGSLTPVDHIIDDLASRFQNVTAISTAMVGDRAFVAAGGSDSGVTLFELLPGGRLHRVETLLDGADRALASVGAVELVATGSVLNLYVGSLTETGVTHFRRDVAQLAANVTGTGGDDSLTGTAGDEVIWGRAGDDIIDAGAGDDIVMDGSGSDQMTGGAGADRFVLANDDRADTIMDFNAAEDMIDLSGWTFLRSAQQVTFTTTATGAQIAFGNELLEIISHDQQGLTEGEVFGPETFNVSRFPVGNPSAGNDITGTGGNDDLTGGPEDNVIEGLAGADTLRGGAGDDLLVGGAGGDRLEGGIGEDTAGYASAAAAIVADLQFAGVNTGDAAGDAFIGIEHLEGSSFNDNLRGDDFANRIDGGDGNDQIFGRDGDDTLLGGAGADILLGGLGADRIDGGAGIDRAAYWQAATGMRLDLIDASLNTGEAAGDLFFGIEDVQGSNFDDDVRGDNAVNRIWGGAGRDTLFGRGGEDQLYGGDGDDILLGGAGPDVMDGGAGRDRAAYWTAPTAILADLIYAEIGTGDAAGDKFTGVEDLQGTNFNDNLRGTNDDNRIWGVGGNDQIYGRGGNDQLYGQDGNDILLGDGGADLIDGGAGVDRVAFWTAPGAVRVDLLAPGNNTGDAAGDIYLNVEDVQGTGFDDDLRGDNLGNRLWGGVGQDTLHGRGGEDQLYGQNGDDLLLPGAQADLVDGGAGIDRVAYWTSGSAVTASLANPGANTGDAAGDTYIDIEELQGTNFNDDLEGDAGDNGIFGGNGNDTLDGGLGNDVLVGGAGADSFIFASGNDTVRDFVSGTDLLTIGAAGASGLSASDVLAQAQAVNGGTLMTFGGDSLFLEEILPGGLSVNDLVIL